MRKTRLLFALLQFGPQILHNYVASSSPRSVISVTQPRRFWKMRNAARILLRGLRRMARKACIDAFWPNTSQANYFKGFWRITSKLNAKMQVRKQQESPSRLCLPHILSDTLQTRRIPSRLAFCLQSLAYVDESYQ